MSEQNPDADSIANKPPVPPRDDLVNTAAKFLLSPNVLKSPQDMKVAFLKKKGLSDVEIELAIKQCEANLQSRAHEQNPPPLPYSSPALYQQSQPISFWNRHPRWYVFRDVMNTIMLLAGVLYGMYWIYKKYVWNYLFGERKKKSSSDRLTDIEANLSAVTCGIDSLKESMDHKGPLAREIGQLKVEIATVKKMLLGRKQFPSAGSVPLSIPSWQIAGANAADEKEEEGAATNGSDSSLEMIKE